MYLNEEEEFLVSKEKRFITIHKEGTLSGYKVILDSKTGVNYLFTVSGRKAHGFNHGMKAHFL